MYRPALDQRAKKIYVLRRHVLSYTSSSPEYSTHGETSSSDGTFVLTVVLVSQRFRCLETIGKASLHSSALTFEPPHMRPSKCDMQEVAASKLLNHTLASPAILAARPGWTVK